MRVCDRCGRDLGEQYESHVRTCMACANEVHDLTPRETGAVVVEEPEPEDEPDELLTPELARAQLLAMREELNDADDDG